jgi:ribosome-binding factor A
VLLAREVRDPGIGFITLTRVKVSPDLQLVRVYYTTMGDDRAKRTTQQALERATPFLRRAVGGRIQLRRVPELRFEFDKGVEHQDRVERILLDLSAEREARGGMNDIPVESGKDAARPDEGSQTRDPESPESPDSPESDDHS